jgi:hypothetical protein
MRSRGWQSQFVAFQASLWPSAAARPGGVGRLGRGGVHIPDHVFGSLDVDDTSSHLLRSSHAQPHKQRVGEGSGIAPEGLRPRLRSGRCHRRHNASAMIVSGRLRPRLRSDRCHRRHNASAVITPRRVGALPPTLPEETRRLRPTLLRTGWQANARATNGGCWGQIGSRNPTFAQVLPTASPGGPACGAARVARPTWAGADQSQLGLSRAFASAMPPRHAVGPAEDYAPPSLERNWRREPGRLAVRGTGDDGASAHRP